MPSSISPSNSRIPWLAIRLLVVAIAAWCVAAVYTLRVNPEIRHFRYSDTIKKRWADEMSLAHGSKVVVYGGSSCEFAFDGERMLERFGLACVNAGRGAGMGISVLTMAALRDCRTNDTLVVALEPVLLTEPLSTPTLGVQFSIAAGHPEWILDPLPPAASISPLGAALALRPGGYHTFTLLGKLIQGRPFYRYRDEDLRPSGWIQTPVRVPVTGPPRHGIEVAEDCLAYLRSLSEWCRRHQVRLAYTLPWGYTPADQVDSFQVDNLRFLLQVAEIMPVLRDPTLGAYSVREHFSDSVWHLTEAGAALRTDAFAEQLIWWEVWTRADLERLLAERAVP